MGAQAVKIKPVDCVPQDDLRENILTNVQLIKEWSGPCAVHDGTAWIFSAGPSLEFAVNEMFTKEYFQALEGRHTIFAIKHALPLLRYAGITPDFCVALDPRDISGISTHDIVRQDLYQAAPKETKMLIASMTHPSVTKYLLGSGYRVIGWHAAAGVIDAMVEEGVLGPTLTLAGGTCSAMRAITMAQHLGYRKAKCIGFDCSLAGEPEDKTQMITTGPADSPKGNKEKPKYFEVLNERDKRDRFTFWTTGELVAQAQDIEALLKNNHMSDLEVRFYAMDPERSYGGNIVEHTPNNTIMPSIEKRFSNGI